ncbi:MAG: SIS domain-containing protein [Caldimonas sp.]
MASTDPHLKALYPFLHGRKADPAELDAALLESVRSKAADSVAAKQRFFSEHAAKVVGVARSLADAYRNGGRLFTMGNGGSSCDASHIAVEFLHPVTVGRPALAAINLNADTAMMSAVANDVGYRHVFVRQLLSLARAGDALIGISTSGNSENLLAAFGQAKTMGLTTIALSGGDGGLMAQSPDVDHCLTVPSDSIHRVQETHVATYHIVWDLVHTLLADTRGSARQS